MHFAKSDAKKLKKLFEAWSKLTVGMKGFGARGVNVPEGISEVLFCIYSGSNRFVKMKKGSVSGSFDTYNLKTHRAEQIKACSVEEDLTSFGPKSKWDDLYFVDFYNGGKVDGTFDVYKIPNKFIKNASLNKDQKFKEQQSEKRRPRFSIKKEIIEKYNLKPEGKNIKLW
ncbi:hypothetical protein A2223_02315 [Candidatus Falkowbacteria bacterium RIFOXYA2_FULL_35_8]|nr:MAG: hypothetical protein A2223_02315 [Candidatus Falkowbacteria bacterium RIFOXYA2_FULL_35_8]